MTTIAVSGATGRMGKMLIEAVLQSQDLELAAALCPEGDAAVGSDAGAFIGKTTGVKISSNIKVLQDCDVLIDFTRPAGTLTYLDACVRFGKGMVIGTTGFDADGIAAINTVGPKLYIEPHSGQPILNNKLGGKGGASGEWVRETALDAIRSIRKAIGDEPIILGMGGVAHPEDVQAMLEAGADSVGIGSALSRVMPTEWEAYLSAMKSGDDADRYLSNENRLVYTPHTVLSTQSPHSSSFFLFRDV